QHLRPVDGDPGDAVPCFVEDVLVGRRRVAHARALSCLCRPCQAGTSRARWSPMIETALHAHLAAAGASYDDDRGVALPRHFGERGGGCGGPARGPALVGVASRPLVRAPGPARVSFLQGMVSNDAARLGSGEGCPALLLTVQGRVTADLRLAALADEIL